MPRNSKNHIEDTDLETTTLCDIIISKQLNKKLESSLSSYLLH